MFRFLRKTEPGEVEFCERCGTVCDRRCRADAIRDGYRDRIFRSGWRFV